MRSLGTRMTVTWLGLASVVAVAVTPAATRAQAPGLDPQAV